MAFEIVAKGIGNSKQLLSNEISVGKYGACFGDDASKFFGKHSRCEVYLDRENNRVGFKRSENSINGFIVGSDKNKQPRKSVTGAWAKLLISGRYPMLIEGEMVVIENCINQETKTKEDELVLL